MLGIYRRHQKHCPHRPEGRKYRRCKCPVWVDGHLNGVDIHKSLGTRDWQKAQGIVRQWEAEGAALHGSPESSQVTVEQAWRHFLTDLEIRKLHPETLRKYRLLQRTMCEFAESQQLRLLEHFNLERLDVFRANWSDGALSAAKKLERLRAFFRFAQSRKWLGENPARELRAPRVSVRPTMPFTREEMLRILAALDTYLEKSSPSGRSNARRLRAIVVLLRYSGLRISDVVSLSTERITGNRLFLYTQKTGVPVQTVLPDFVLRVLEAAPHVSEKYFFWSGMGKIESAVRSWQTRLRKLFVLAKVPHGHAHRFRDTFGVELLLAGVPIERVSILLGHRSVRITEKHYNPWVRARQEQLEADLERAWSHDPVLLLETKGTQKLRGKDEAVN